MLLLLLKLCVPPCRPVLRRGQRGQRCVPAAQPVLLPVGPLRYDLCVLQLRQGVLRGWAMPGPGKQPRGTGAPSAIEHGHHNRGMGVGVRRLHAVWWYCTCIPECMCTQESCPTQESCLCTQESRLVVLKVCLCCVCCRLRASTMAPVGGTAWLATRATGAGMPACLLVDSSAPMMGPAGAVRVNGHNDAPVCLLCLPAAVRSGARCLGLDRLSCKHTATYRTAKSEYCRHLDRLHFALHKPSPSDFHVNEEQYGPSTASWGVTYVISRLRAMCPKCPSRAARRQRGRKALRKKVRLLLRLNGGSQSNITTGLTANATHSPAPQLITEDQRAAPSRGPRPQPSQP
jgi:hypothetical protein